ncbi:hypothetical protein DO021_17680 [Desulfobacter hydrogenophilus]|uniref:Uncharacterized protein n=1 Tax=Desulfobacter hydrogenophilus TaxID=2291 RepID=A0A328FC75_9BACT|nr:hypothetical protein [Desulfobacter hydrogenophilus]NDY73497.1 hypothetical protein [Desulfobacter hydrogenophilus]QBH15720.1 hypothetical protein EYB58_22885 [Desulfobacter hydrogenophilus]RAM00705.1 hypothetical protein DO021_17680 [Desulfobacter hydrogenophilus]
MNIVGEIEGKDYVTLRDFVLKNMDYNEWNLVEPYAEKVKDQTFVYDDFIKAAKLLQTAVPLCALFFKAPAFEAEYAKNILVSVDGTKMGMMYPPTDDFEGFFELWVKTDLISKNGLIGFCIKLANDLHAIQGYEVLEDFGIDPGESDYWE